MKIIGFLLLCLVAMSPKVLGQSPILERGPYLQMAYAIKSGELYSRASITIRWQTDIACLGRVNYSFEPEYELLLASTSGVPFREETVPTRFHKIVLNDLMTDHQYRYNIAVTSAQSPYGPILEKSPDHFFTTPPAPGSKKKIKMWVIGDFAYSPSTKMNLNRQDSTIAAMKDFMAVNKTGPMDMWLWLGDNAYEKGEEADYQDKIFHKGRGRYDWIFRQTPFYATPGNHDYYDRAADSIQRNISRVTKEIHYYSVVDNFKNAEGGGEPSGTEAYYSYDYGNVHFISLDTYGLEKIGDKTPTILKPTSNQYIWLKKDLEKTKNNPDINWTIVFTHMPPFSGGTHDSDVDYDIRPVRDNLVKLLDGYKVDLVMAGHSHDYQRTRLMREHYGPSITFNAALNTNAFGTNAAGSGKYDGTPNSCFYYKNSSSAKNEGIIYVVNGGGGHDEGPNTTNNDSLVTRLMASKEFTGGSMYIEVENKRLTAKFIAANKKVLDQFTIYKDIDNFTVPSTDGVTRTATCECTEDVSKNAVFTHYTDNKGNLLLSINKHGIDIGRAGIPPFDIKLGGAQGRTNVGAFYPQNYVWTDMARTFSSKWRVMNRYWSMKPGIELTGNQQVTVRHYYRRYDLYTISVAETNEDMVNFDNMKFYKINGSSANYYTDPTILTPPTNTPKGQDKMPGALAYNKDGIWTYDKALHYAPADASPLHWKNGYLGNFPLHLGYKSDVQYGEIVVGKLEGGGGIGGQGGGSNPRGSKVLISTNDQWKYFSKGVRPPDYSYLLDGAMTTINWKGGGALVDYYSNVVPWNTGTAPFGYSPGGYDQERWVIPGCPTELACHVDNGQPGYIIPGCVTVPCTETTRWTSYFFRKVLTVAPDLADTRYKSIIINYRRDDGVLIYVNGKELLPRDENMKDIVNDESFATNAVEHQWNTVVIPNNDKLFRKGAANVTNTVAVELRQTSKASSDLYFDMEIVLSQDALTSPVRLAAEGEVKKVTPENTFYPNPTNGIVYFTTPLTYETIKITDSRGIVLRYLSQPGVLNDIDITDMPAGVLILSNQNNGKVVNYKIVKIK